MSSNKFSRFGSPRAWAAVFFGDNAVELTVGKNIGGQINVTAQPGATVPATDATADAKTRWHNAAQTLRQQVDPREHRIATAVGCEDVLCQMLRLPTVAPAELKQMLDLQIDNLTPLPLDEVVYGFQSLEVDETSTRVLVTIARKDAVNERVAALEEAGLPAEVVTVDALTLFQGMVSRQLLPLDDKLNSLIVLNANASHLIVHARGHPLAVRSIVIGAPELLTEPGQAALCEELQRTLVAAEIEQPRAERGQATFLTWTDELRTAATQIAERCGGAHEVLTNGAVPSPVVALCQLVASGAAGQLNLLPEEWRERRRKVHVRRTMVRAGIAAGALYVLALIGFLSVMAVQKSRLQNLSAEVRTLKPQYEDAKQLHAQLLAMKKQLDTKFAALEVLREVSAALPDNVKLNSFQFKRDQTVTLRGQAQSNSHVLEFSSKLEKSPLFASVKPGQSVTPPGGGLTRFEITCTLKSATEMPTATHGHH